MKKTAALVFSICLMLVLFAGCTDRDGGLTTTPGTSRQTTPGTSAPSITTVATTMDDTSMDDTSAGNGSGMGSDTQTTPAP